MFARQAKAETRAAQPFRLAVGPPDAAGIEERHDVRSVEHAERVLDVEQHHAVADRLLEAVPVHRADSA